MKPRLLLPLLLPWLGCSSVEPDALRGEVYSTIEIPFVGPDVAARDTPARDIELWAAIRHESGEVEHKVYGFWDGDGHGGMAGSAFKIRFTPTRPGAWTLAEVHSNHAKLRGQRQGDSITALPGRLPGFWEVDDESPGRRWYRRSDGSHPYIFGNTQYSFLSGYRDDGPSGVDIARDVARNAEFFRKLRFSLFGDRYVHPVEKPFLDDDGNPSDDGGYSHRPSPRWFHQRADVAVRAALAHDLIADLILCGPDTAESRSTLQPRFNGGDPEPWLRYVAARYGSFANVWFCVCNEYDIKTPSYTQQEAARFGSILRKHLPYPSPVSIHPGSRILWADGLDAQGAWHDHHIIQRKIREMPVSADVMAGVWRPDRQRPTVNDELSYQGEGDQHTEADSIESHLGAFLGGGYASAGFKPGNKLGHYFWGGFDPDEHTAARGLKFLREAIDTHVAFWKMEPGAAIFRGLDQGFRAMSSEGEEYVLGTNRARAGIVANLPKGAWTVRRFDAIARQATVLAEEASGSFSFDSPDSRAVLFHFKRN